MHPVLASLKSSLLGAYFRASAAVPVHLDSAFLGAPLPAPLAGHAAAGEPSLRGAGWQPVTASQYREPEYLARCADLAMAPLLHRKQWEWAYILQVLEEQGALRPGARGLGFGCGTEPLAAALARRGCSVLATDLEAGRAARGGWVATAQHASRLADLAHPEICDGATFARLVSFRACDMNHIPGDLEGFDFAWSSCALEHLGSLEHGLRFVEQSARCLRPGGVAVHTTELNLGSNRRTLETRQTCIYRRRDLEALAVRLLEAGHEIGTVSFRPGREPPDLHLDVPPYRSPIHLRLRTGRFLRQVSTSFGLWLRRGPGEPAGSR